MRAPARTPSPHNQLQPLEHHRRRTLPGPTEPHAGASLWLGRRQRPVGKARSLWRWLQPVELPFRPPCSYLETQRLRRARLSSPRRSPGWHSPFSGPAAGLPALLPQPQPPLWPSPRPHHRHPGPLKGTISCLCTLSPTARAPCRWTWGSQPPRHLPRTHAGAVWTSAARS